MTFDPKQRESAIQEITKELYGETPEKDDDVLVDNDSPNDPEVESDDEQTPETEEKVEKPDDQEEIKTLSELASAIGLDPAQLYELEIKLTETGESIKLGSLKDELQNLKKSQIDFDKQRAELAAEKVKYQQILADQIKATTELNDAELKSLVEMKQCQVEYAQVDWEEFEKLDPGKAALHQQKLLNRYNLANQQYQTAQQQKTQLNQQKFNEFITQQNDQLLKLVPDWTDSAKFNSDVAAITKWARETYNLTDQDLGSVIDARHRDIIRKAYLYDSLQKSKSGILKSAVKQLAGNSKPIRPADIQTKRINSLILKARRSRNQSDQLAAARAILDNS